MNKPLLSINIVSYNTKDITLQCLRSSKIPQISLAHQRPWEGSEIVLVDNASTDGSADAIEDMKGTLLSIRLIRDRENIGFHKGSNKAATNRQVNAAL